MSSSTVTLCRLEELPDGAARGFDPFGAGHDTLFIVRRGAQLHAWRDRCPHMQGVSMAWRKDAYLNAKGDRIVCSAHGATFDVVTGRCLIGPCEGQFLQPVGIAVTGAGEVMIARHEADE